MEHGCNVPHYVQCIPNAAHHKQCSPVTIEKIRKNYSANFIYLCVFINVHRKHTKQIFPEMKLRGLVPNFYIHVFVSELYIPTIGPLFCCSKIGRPIVGIYKSLTNT